MGKITEIPLEDEDAALYGPSPLDPEIERMFLEGKGRDWQPLTEDNWEEEIQNVPLFMNRMPSKKDNAECNAALEALQSLAYDGTPEEIATNFKNQGNEIVREKVKAKLPHAVRYYTKALEQRCGNDEIETTCLLNRAAVNMDLENYRSVITDCQRALKRNIPTESLRVKAYFRLAKALLALQHYPEDALKTIRAAFQQLSDMDGANRKSFELLEEQANRQIQTLAELRAKQEREASEQEHRQQALVLAVQQRGIHIIPSNSESSRTPSKLFPLPVDLNYRPALADPLDSSSGLSWPVVVIYPQIGQFDIVQSWDENTRLLDMLAEMFAGREEEFSVDGDPNFRYSHDSVAVYVPVISAAPSSSTARATPSAISAIGGATKSTAVWKRARMLGTLREVLGNGGCPVDADLVVRLWVVPKTEGAAASNAWTREWLKVN